MSLSQIKINRVEIEINSNCNRHCSYCPNAMMPLQAPRYMRMQLFKKIIDELVELNFNGRLSYHFYNEPLLHPNIDDFVSYVCDKLPDIENVLYTNGDFLTDTKYNQLLKAGISHFVITNHGDGNDCNYEKATLLKPSDLTLTNRAGCLFNLDQAVEQPCYVPAERLIIGYDGIVVLCYEDAKRANILGDINVSSIRDIWLSDKYVKIRNQLSAGLRSMLVPCCQCNNLAHVKPNYISMIQI